MDRTGLYIMVLVIMLNTCSVAQQSDVRHIEERLDRIEKALPAPNR